MYALVKRAVVIAGMIALIAGSAIAQQPAPTVAQPGYVLGAGDVIRMTVFGEPDLSGEFEVGANGSVSLPLIGDAPIGGLSISAAEALIEQKLAAGYVQAPNVAIDVLNYRPFFVLGEVNNQGVFPFVADLTVLKAIAIAGGFTYRADKDDIVVKLGGLGEEIPIGQDDVINAGDIIIVNERWF